MENTVPVSPLLSIFENNPLKRVFQFGNLGSAELFISAFPAPTELIARPENENVELKFEVDLICPPFDQNMPVDISIGAKVEKTVFHQFEEIFKSLFLNGDKYNIKKIVNLKIQTKKKKVILLINFNVTFANGVMINDDISIPIVLYDHQSPADLAGAFADAAYLPKEVLSFENAASLAIYWCKYFVLGDSSVKRAVKKRGRNDASEEPEFSFGREASKEQIIGPLTKKALDILLRKVVNTFDKETTKKTPKKPEYKRFLFALLKLIECVQKPFILPLWIEGNIAICEEEEIKNLLYGNQIGTFCLKLSNSFFALWAREPSDKRSIEEAEESMGPFVVPTLNGEREIDYWNPPLKIIKNRSIVDLILNNSLCAQFINPSGKLFDRYYILKEPKSISSTSTTHKLNNPNYNQLSNRTPVNSPPATPFVTSPMDSEIIDFLVLDQVSTGPAASQLAPPPQATPSANIDSVLATLGLSEYLPKFKEEALDIEELKMIPKNEFITVMKTLGLKLGEIVKLQNELKLK